MSRLGSHGPHPGRKNRTQQDRGPRGKARKELPRDAAESDPAPPLHPDRDVTPSTREQRQATDDGSGRHVGVTVMQSRPRGFWHALRGVRAAPPSRPVGHEGELESTWAQDTTCCFDSRRRKPARHGTAPSRPQHHLSLGRHTRDGHAACSPSPSAPSCTAAWTWGVFCLLAFRPITHPSPGRLHGVACRSWKLRGCGLQRQARHWIGQG